MSNITQSIIFSIALNESVTILIILMCQTPDIFKKNLKFLVKILYVP